MNLFPHNQFAYDKVSTFLKENNRACIVQPTGTGKSFITAEFLKENPNKKFLLLTSNSYIINQFDNLFKKYYKNYIYKTYPSLLSIDFKELLKEDIDYIILDEFHRIGAKLWGNKVELFLNHYQNAKVVGLTATHIRYMDEERNLIDEYFDGNLVHHLTLMECFDTGILPRPKYISTIYNIDDEYNSLINKINQSKSSNKSALRERIIEYKAKWEFSNGADIILKKHINRERNFLVFCRDINHLEEMILIVKNWFKKFNIKTNIFKVYSIYEDSKNELEKYHISSTENNNEFNLLFSVQQLNEGLHAPNVHGIIFLRPTESHIIYYQQLGRGLSSKGNQPIVFDMVNNFKKSKVHSDFSKKIYDPVFKNDYLKNDYEKYKFSFEIIDEIKSIHEIFEKIKISINNDYEEVILDIKNHLLENKKLTEQHINYLYNARHAFLYKKYFKDEKIKLLDELIPLLKFDWKVYNIHDIERLDKMIVNIKRKIILEEALSSREKIVLNYIRLNKTKNGKSFIYSLKTKNSIEDLKSVGFNNDYKGSALSIYYLNFKIKQLKNKKWENINKELKDKIHGRITNYHRKYLSKNKINVDIETELNVTHKLTGKNWTKTSRIKKTSFEEYVESITFKLDNNILPNLKETKWVSYKKRGKYKTSEKEMKTIEEIVERIKEIKSKKLNNINL